MWGGSSALNFNFLMPTQDCVTLKSAWEAECLHIPECSEHFCLLKNMFLEFLRPEFLGMPVKISEREERVIKLALNPICTPSFGVRCR